jgi:Cu(I)/Ag(I) efflux system membrane fusion protein
MARLAIALVAALAGAALATGFLLTMGAETALVDPHVAAGTRYQCAMHPQIVSDRPGVCPICQMKLQPISEPVGVTGKQRVLFYRHPMRPDVTSPEPAKDEMGMSYLPVYEDDVAAATGPLAAGRAPFALSSERQQLIGVTRAPVERRELFAVIRAAGRVAYDPMLYQAIVEYREAQRAKSEIHASPWQQAHDGAEALLRAAALKLRQQGLSEAQIRALSSGGEPLNLLLPGKAVWVYAQVYESEADLVRPGQTLEITAPSLPGRRYEARVASIDPILNVASRTVRVRALVATPDESLRPETFVEVRLRVPLGETTAVPAEAVLNAGAQQVAFVVRDGGIFEPRALQLGRQAEGFYEVKEGLVPGEEVVTSANFLIDSESRFKAAVAAFKKSPTAATPPATP